MDDEELAGGGEPGQEGEEEGEGSHEDSAPEIITMPSRFDQVQEKGYIDVWWLYDDGGKKKYCYHFGYNIVCVFWYTINWACFMVYMSCACTFIP